MSVFTVQTRDSFLARGDVLFCLWKGHWQLEKHTESLTQKWLFGKVEENTEPNLQQSLCQFIVYVHADTHMHSFFILIWMLMTHQPQGTTILSFKQAGLAQMSNFHFLSDLQLFYYS